MKKYGVPQLGVVLTAVMSAGFAHGAPGSLDSNFSGDGVATINQFQSGNSIPYHQDHNESRDNRPILALDSKGRIVAGGTSYVYRTYLTRLNTDGTIDGQFGEAGVLAYAFNSGGYFTQSEAIALAANGDLIVASETGQESYDAEEQQMYYSTAPGLKRFLPDGKFAQTGWTGVGVGTSRMSNVRCVAIQGDGAVLVAGNKSYLTWQDYADMVVVRYKDGVADSNYGTGGVAKLTFSPVTPSEPWDDCTAMALQADGKSVIVGSTGHYNAWDLAMARLDTAGNPDPTFGTGGKVITNIAGNDRPQSVVIQKDGKILVAGYNSASFFRRFFVARYKPDGKLDPTFCGDGTFEVDVDDYPQQSVSVAMQADGKIVLAGSLYQWNVGTSSIMLRLHSNGDLDQTFGDQGILEDPFQVGDVDNLIDEIKLQADGRLVVLGTVENTRGDEYPTAARFNMLIKPDMLLGLTTGATTGSKIYNKTGAGQTLETKISKNGGKATVYLKIRNDGHEVETFKIKGGKGDNNFDALYFSGKKDVTAAVTKGNFLSSRLMPGFSQSLTLQLTAKTANPGKNRSLPITVSSPADSLAVDTVLVKATSK